MEFARLRHIGRAVLAALMQIKMVQLPVTSYYLAEALTTLHRS